jgi:hypothetical protein
MFSLRKSPVIGAALTGLVLAIILFAGCNSDPGDDLIAGLDPRLVGTWKSAFDEVYEITETHLTFDNGYGGSWGGTIEYAARFDKNTGIIIIQYDDADSKQEWAMYGPPPGYDFLGYHDTTGKDFYGIYFRDLTQNSVVFSNTSNQTDFSPSETVTLQQAKNRFTLDNMPDWIDISFAMPFDRVGPKE